MTALTIRPGLYVVQLDRRDLKSPSGKPLHLPPSKLAVAALIAHEWDTQEEVLKPHGLPIVCLDSVGCLGPD